MRKKGTARTPRPTYKQQVTKRNKKHRNLELTISYQSYKIRKISRLHKTTFLFFPKFVKYD